MHSLVIKVSTIVWPLQGQVTFFCPQPKKKKLVHLNSRQITVTNHIIFFGCWHNAHYFISNHTLFYPKKNRKNQTQKKFLRQPRPPESGNSEPRAGPRRPSMSRVLVGPPMSTTPAVALRFLSYREPRLPIVDALSGQNLWPSHIEDTNHYS